MVISVNTRWITWLFSYIWKRFPANSRKETSSSTEIKLQFFIYVILYRKEIRFRFCLEPIWLQTNRAESKLANVDFQISLLLAHWSEESNPSFISSSFSDLKWVNNSFKVQLSMRYYCNLHCQICTVFHAKQVFYSNIL